MAKKTRTELSTLAINTNLPDNTTELITPTTERAQLTDERESVVNYKDDLGGVPNAGKFLTVAVDGESLTMVDEPQGDIQGSGVDGQITYWDGTKTVTSDAMLLIDTTNKTLKIVIPLANGSGGISLNAVSASATSSLTFLNNGVTMAQIYYDNSTANLRLASDGDVEINPSGTLSVDSGATFSGAATFNGLLEVINSYVNFTRGGKLLQFNPNFTNSNLYAQIDSALPLHLAVGGADALTISSGGLATFQSDSNKVTINSTNSTQATLELGRSVDTKAKITSGDVSANDLNLYTLGVRKLSIGSNWASTLDAYEEGTWTPTNQGTSNITVGPTAFAGTYTRIGNRVFVEFKISGITAPYTGALIYIVLAGFPYVQASNSIVSNGIVTNYPNSRQAGGVENNSGGDNNNWFVYWENTVSNQSNQAIFGSLTYFTS